ncbi:MAG: ATP-binding protein [Bacilli bacterium]|nr:ATP-binding protein [Bacilli bacterium]
MLGSIKEIIDNSVIIKLDIDISNQPNLVNLHVVFENEGKRIVGEIANVNQTEMLANIVGEIESDTSFIPGATLKPSFKSQVRLIKMEELALILGDQELKPGYTNFGSSNVYTNYRINVPINDFFSNHFAVLGNSGAGKSSTVASIIQKLFRGNKTPINSTMFFFDAFGEYTQAFTSLHEENNNINYKCYTTNPETPDGELLRIPVWLLDLDDLALLLDANNAAQLPVIEKTLKLVPILTGTSESTIKRKNDIIARAVQEIMLSGGDSVKIHDQVVAVLTKFNTPTFNLQTQIVQPGYTRTLKQCLFVDKTGKMQEMELVVEFIRGYIMEDVYEIPDEELNKFYSLKDLELALEFALIDEGALNSDQVFDYANIISVRLHSLVNGETAKYFEYPNYVTKDQYIDSLLFDKASGGKSQIVNFNINYVDDRIAKVMTKIISRMIFMRGALTRPRGSNAYHIIIEEAHRYVQKDKDVELLGYNIFERISKEGRKYGVFLAFITQRPSELSDTCISQCSNFVILRLLHPKDLNYVKEMVPNITSEIVLQLKNLKPGNAIAFGTGFKVPIALKIDRPNPEPLSSNVNLEDVWYRQPQFGNVQAIQNQDLGDPVIVDDNTSFVAMTEQPPQQ